MKFIKNTMPEIGRWFFAVLNCRFKTFPSLPFTFSLKRNSSSSGITTKQGFTLAKILIILGIVGVVAAFSLLNIKDKADEIQSKRNSQFIYNSLRNSELLFPLRKRIFNEFLIIRF